VFGRSGTDGADQFRKNINCSGRRMVRDGVKGFLFTCDCSMTNAMSMKNTKNKKVTQISFVVEYVEFVFDRWTARRSNNAAKKTQAPQPRLITGGSMGSLSPGSLMQLQQRKGGAGTAPKGRQRKPKQGAMGASGGGYSRAASTAPAIALSVQSGTTPRATSRSRSTRPTRMIWTDLDSAKNRIYCVLVRCSW
jgi:hypothetical protein